jgi:transposase
MSRRSYDANFKIDAASLVIDQGYSVPDACRAVGVGETALRSWVNQLKEERKGIKPAKGKALTPEQQTIQALEAKIRRIERENEILKKATVLLMSDSIKSL